MQQPQPQYQNKIHLRQKHQQPNQQKMPYLQKMMLRLLLAVLPSMLKINSRFIRQLMILMERSLALLLLSAGSRSVSRRG
ncbi:hypothetical protein P831_04259 [Klebsiella aerogenes UCI 28]|nr:hypothetical protein P848_02514 [Klebsiella aerogenes UCI 45]EUL75683.1 hypothetical protein P831_04259 [Klebsiella aerogenes UCI 28]EUL83219.1 hypothetical protein P830_02234 [Klebsiella aerogenes UCI 27]